MGTSRKGRPSAEAIGIMAARRRKAYRAEGMKEERERLLPLLKKCEGILSVSRGSTQNHARALAETLDALRAELERKTT